MQRNKDFILLKLILNSRILALLKLLQLALNGNIALCVRGEQWPSILKITVILVPNWEDLHMQMHKAIGWPDHGWLPFIRPIGQTYFKRGDRPKRSLPNCHY